MNEIEKMLNKENAEKKRIARGDHNKVRGGGRNVKMPSDYLSKKEREKLNGEVFTFDPRRFYNWDEFKALPDVYQLKWVNSVINRYNVGVSTISRDVLGKSPRALGLYLDEKSLAQYVNKGGTGKAAVAGRKRLRADMERNEPILPQEEAPNSATEATTEIGCEEHPVAVTPIAPEPRLNAADLAVLLQSLVGTGARLTIEVTL